MSKITEINIIIPAYNPDNKLVKLIEELKESNFNNIIVVDDGSQENCQIFFEKAKSLGAIVLKHEVNQGKGRALKTAFDYCLKQDSCEGVITVDGDGQHLVKDIYACSELMLKNENKVVIGVRDFSGKDIPFRSKFGNNMTRMVFKLLCNISISDTQTGLRAIPHCFLEQLISYEGERYEYETNMLLMMHKQQIQWKELKISTVYIDDNDSSHFNPIKDSIKIYKVILNHKRRK